MNVPEILDPRKQEGRVVYMALIVLLVGLGAFGLGHLSNEMGNQSGVSIAGSRVSASALLASQSTATTSKVSGGSDAIPGGVVGTGSWNKYYFPWCGAGAKAIQNGTAVWFASARDAQDAGLSPAQNCKGLQ